MVVECSRVVEYSGGRARHKRRFSDQYTTIPLSLILCLIFFSLNIFVALFLFCTLFPLPSYVDMKRTRLHIIARKYVLTLKRIVRLV